MTAGGLGLRDPRSVMVFDGKVTLNKMERLEQQTETNARALGSLIGLLNDQVDTVHESANLIQELAARVAALEARENVEAPREPLPIPDDLAALSWGDLRKVAGSHGLRGKREEIVTGLEALRGAAS